LAASHELTPLLFLGGMEVDGSSKFKRLEDRLSAYGPDVAAVIRRVLLEEQRKLGLKNPRDIVTIIERVIDEAATDPIEAEA
jgi:hypothetical protein